MGVGGRSVRESRLAEAKSSLSWRVTWSPGCGDAGAGLRERGHRVQSDTGVTGRLTNQPAPPGLELRGRSLLGRRWT